MKNNSQGTILNRVLKELKTYRLQVVISLICAIATVYFTLRIPILIGKAVDCITSDAAYDYEYFFFVLYEILKYLSPGLYQLIITEATGPILC